MRRCIRGFRSTSLAVGFLLIAAAAAAAQQGAIEAGVDARLAFLKPDGGDGVTVLEIPVSLIRVGYMVTPTVMIEPAFRLSYVAREGDNSSSQDIFVNVLWHNRPLDDGPVYAGGGLGLNRIAFGGDSATRFAIGARAGIKPPIASNVLARLGGFLVHRFEHEDAFIAAVTEFGVEAGVSLLIR